VSISRIATRWVTAVYGLGRFLAMVKNIDHYLSQVRFPPRAASLRREQESHVLASSERERAVLAAERASRTPVRCGRRNEDTGIVALLRRAVLVGIVIIVLGLPVGPGGVSTFT
jgi:hypothetical protein